MTAQRSIREDLDRLVNDTWQSIRTTGTVHDPVRFPARFTSREDVSVSGLISASLALGQVPVMLNRLNRIFGTLGPHPARTLREGTFTYLMKELHGFRYRFVSDRALASFLAGIGGVLRSGPLDQLLKQGDVVRSAATIRQAILAKSPDPGAIREANLMADPDKGSSLKRWMLYFRWMVRNDPIDFGIWQDHIGTDRLIVPLDTHMLRIARFLGLTERRSADLRTAREITEAFRKICPEDPVKYDFALVRMGINGLCSRLSTTRPCPSCPLQPHCTIGRMGSNLNQPKGN